MLNPATLTRSSPEIAIAVEKMAMTMLSLGEWLLKQQQQLKQQQRFLEEKQQLIQEQQQEIEQLKEALEKLKNRSSSNSSTPPSADLLKKPRDKSQRKKGKKRGPKYDRPGKTRNGFGAPDQIIELAPETCPVCQLTPQEPHVSPEGERERNAGKSWGFDAPNFYIFLANVRR